MDSHEGMEYDMFTISPGKGLGPDAKIGVGDEV